MLAVLHWTHLKSNIEYVHTILVITYLSLICHFKSCGQKLSEATNEAKVALEDYAMENWESYSSEEKVRLKGTLKKLGAEPKLHFMKYAPINKETLLPLISTMSTYIIILLQFKQGQF